MPLANSYLKFRELDEDEPRYPLHALVCDRCLLVQLDVVVAPEEIFNHYAYFSSYSTTWVEHARRFAEEACRTLGLTERSLVVEVASNDGYLLRHFLARGTSVLGVEPAWNVAKVAIEAGIPTEMAFFGTGKARELSGRGLKADLVVANNVLAHVPDLDDFVAGISQILHPDGVVTIEVPSLLQLITNVQFDTIYHEHLSYFSLFTAEQVLVRHGLNVFDVEELSTHGGSLRIWADPGGRRGASVRLLAARKAEQEVGISRAETYSGFQRRADACRRSLLELISSAKAQGETIVAYGAAAKGNTLLNYCQLSPDDIAYVVDRSPHKQGKFLPGTHIPIYSPERVFETRPHYLLILPWNLRGEIMDQMSGIREWGGRFVTPIPAVQVHP
ncbi:MAG: class I SAM-dependent methyltransferase [Actinomycetota bacterium]|nr:class I SAM-dependent methyltransferase [Actinomycetota bacterium]